MDESAVRDLFECATDGEPPMGPVAHNSLLAGLRLRRRRRTRAAVSGAAVVAVLGAGIPLAAGSSGHSPGMAAAAQPQWLGRAAYVLIDAYTHSGHKSGDTPVEGWVLPISQATHRPGRPITTGRAPAAIVFTPSGRTAYVANQGSGTVTPITTADNMPRRPIKVGASPDALAVTPNGRTVYVVNQGSGTVTPITTATDQAGEPIAIPDAVGSILMSPGGKTVYVQTLNAVVPISTATNTVGQAITLLPGTKPNTEFRALGTPMAITPNGRTLYALDFGADKTRLVPVQTATGEPGQPIAAGYRPDALVVNPDGRSLYAGSSNSGRVTVISTATNKPVKTVKTGGCPGPLAVTPNGRTVYTLNVCNGSSSVIPIVTATNTVGRLIKVLPEPSWLAMTQGGKTLYVGSTQSNTVTPIATGTNRAGKPIKAGGNSTEQLLTGVAVAP